MICFSTVALRELSNNQRVKTKALSRRPLLPLLGGAFLLAACSDGTREVSNNQGSGGGLEGSGGANTEASGGSASGASNSGGRSSSSGGASTGGAGQQPGGSGGVAIGAGGTGGEPSSCVPDGKARNPLISHIFTADPNAIVYDDKVYVYVSHDADGQEGFDMIDHHVYSSDDLVNWQDHGVAIKAADLGWAGVLYAPGACKMGDTYYMYLTNGGSQIGVAVSDHPGGPFVDPLKGPLFSTSFPNANVPWLFDPACFIDDDGQPYLYFGGGPSGDNARVFRLNEDMVSIKDSSATKVPTTAFFEASFMHKHEGKYYFSYSSDFSAGHGATLEYYMGDSPMMSGAEYKGVLLKNSDINNGNNSHGSIIEYKGKHYLFYHNRKLMQSLGTNKVNNRSIAFQELTYAEDGSINTLDMSTEDFTVSQLKCLNAFEEVEAERLGAEQGIEVEGDAGDTVRVASIDPGDWVAYSQVDFRDGATSLVAQVAASEGGGTIDVLVDGCIDSTDGTSVGTCDVAATGGFTTFSELKCTIDAPAGAHDLCLKFSGTTSFEIDSFHLE